MVLGDRGWLYPRALQQLPANDAAMELSPSNLCGDACAGGGDVFLSPPPPGPPFIVSPPENITVNISQDALFTCQAEAYPGNLTYLWYWEEENVYFKK